MRIYGRKFTLTLIFLALTLALTVASWRGSANQNFDSHQTSAQETTPDNDVPVLDLKQTGSTVPDPPKGKNRRGLRQDREISELPMGVEPLPFSSSAFARLPALPVEQSNAIIVGKVTDRRAVVTDDKLSIYSEFTIGISEVLKDDQRLLHVGQVVTVGRSGGAVRFPSGRIQRYTIFGQGFPQQSKLYYLFLKYDEGQFSILTGYEVDGAVIQPLDGKRYVVKKEDDLQFGVYRGVSRDSFVYDLRKVLQQTGGGQ